MSRDLAPGLLSIARFVPPHRYPQHEVTAAVARWLEETESSTRLLSVYGNAGVRTRGSVATLDEVFHPKDFEAQNDRYREVAKSAAIAMARQALTTAELSSVDAIVSVSCTGFMIPAVDAWVADALQLGPRLVRLPITESGCAGGVVGLARATDYLRAHPDKAALVVSIEMSSLTFQSWDRSATNLVSTAIFGDGGAAVVLVGAHHPLAGRAFARVVDAESVFFRGTTHLMGFRLRNQGLQIVLDRELAPFVRREVAPAVNGFLAERGLKREDVARWILHPGGRRIIEVMAEKLELAEGDLAATEAVLSEHGNMSSATVLFVLDEIARNRRPAAGAHALMAAFGPGFGAELLLLQFA